MKIFNFLIFILFFSSHALGEGFVAFERDQSVKQDINCPSGFVKFFNNRVRFANAHEFFFKDSVEVEKTRNCSYEITYTSNGDKFNSSNFLLHKITKRKDCVKEELNGIDVLILERVGKRLSFSSHQSNLNNKEISRTQCAYMQ